MTSEIGNLFSKLKGEWLLDRIIQDQDEHYYKGRAVFYPNGENSLIYKEEGVLTLSGGDRLETSRSFIYMFDGDVLKIFYNDPHRQGELMHEMIFSQDSGFLRASHCHFCGKDQYELTITAQENNRIEMKYIILGPKKNYSITTILSPSRSRSF